MEGEKDVDHSIQTLEQLAIDQPDVAAVHNNLGVAYKNSGRIDEAIASLHRAIELAPTSAQVWNNLGNAFRVGGALDDAVAAYQQSLALSPRHVPSLSNLATALHESGRLYDAIDRLREAIEIDPTHVGVHSNLLYHLHFDPRMDAHDIRREHQIWNERHAKNLRRAAPFANERSPDRMLRIAYVSSHFRNHVIGRFIAPLIRNHDVSRFDVRCYSPADEIPEIDIAVDLDMHLAGGQPLIFARGLAPVQVTYLGYVAGDGVDGIDYRFSDPYLDSIGWEPNYIEKTVRLPCTYWCYEPPADVEGALVKHDTVTFGCLNNFAKTMPAALPVWGEILRRVPASRLIISSPSRSTDQLAIDQLRVDPARLTFVRFQKIEDYLKVYNKIDVALDPFPYAGGTTTCDAVYMGVPVVTLAGKTSVGRGGVSILSNLGLQQLIAETPERYIEIATSVPRVSDLRGRMVASRLMDAERFARDFESALRQMWRDWCASSISDSSG